HVPPLRSHAANRGEAQVLPCKARLPPAVRQGKPVRPSLEWARYGRLRLSRWQHEPATERPARRKGRRQEYGDRAACFSCSSGRARNKTIYTGMKRYEKRRWPKGPVPTQWSTFSWPSLSTRGGANALTCRAG